MKKISQSEIMQRLINNNYSFECAKELSYSISAKMQGKYNVWMDSSKSPTRKHIKELFKL